jgi:hypothetical protein
MAAQEQSPSGPIVSQLQITPEPSIVHQYPIAPESEIVTQHHERIHHYVIAGAVGTIIGFMLAIVVTKLRN